MQDSPPSFPLPTGLEARIAAHEIAQVRMQLVLCAHPQLERVEKGDEALSDGTATTGTQSASSREGHESKVKMRGNVPA